ncbi:MAG: hypothetical protein KDA79_23955, partial [Planctomycetaceae bacterium]|nr:hypothetical protein [Planctomycetaceae bacterium]
MSTDVYQLCPCGSGKKLKFCCQAIAGDMEKISRLQETNQNRRAMQKLEDLARKHPANPWVVTTRAAVLLAEGHSAEARTVLEPFVNEHPEHEFALVLYAGAVFSEDGYEAARGVVHLAFQRCPASCPEMVSGLALGVAGYMFGTGRYMAARQHLTLAMRLSADRDQQDIFLRLLELDSNRSISYPLRSVHQLSSFAGLPDDTDTQEVLRKVRRLANVGCWGTAARLMRGLTEANAESAELWRNIGLCHAWDGEEASAAEALHQAARLESNRDTAIETEVLAQLLEMKYGPDVKESIDRCWDVASASQTLTAFDRAERLEREPDDEGEESFSVGTYAVLDRPMPDSVPDTDPDVDAVPRVLANVVVLDSGQRQLEQPRVMLVGLEDEHFEECSRLVEEVLGSDAKLLTSEEAGLDRTTRGKRPAEAEPFTWNFRFPESTSVSVVRKYNAHAWDHA